MQDISKHPIFQALQKIIHDAADVIMDIYQRADLGIEQKPDDSPVTAADLAAHKVILAGLQALTPDIPVLSEESSEEGQVTFEERSKWPMLWIVDPLDGTKEFIKRNGEFSINIALVENGAPILGVVYIPTTTEGYFGVTKVWQGLPVGAFKWQGDEYESINVREPREPIIAMTSRSHGPALPASLKNKLKQSYEQVRELPKGSSIKGCRIAEGIADLHLRRGPTSEWDTAAQQAIIEAAGGMLVTPDGKPFRYNQRETLLNGHFFVSGAELAPYVMNWYLENEEEE
ncbi:3'(2'),5'-bisphosphate nucleotidase [Marinomonas sp. UCMA 3892]|uniref:3'(2'),5'-bisphosphate nucleotidase CysQ n=1 Tax=Marinomonas sp. UCMA 3892 TaxID=1972585 RepID=UPI00146AB067|nr:3'(2'),5'-bisphosphate nucleotidase CysQ [Marinomonas sp. UCMA 3892]NLU98004.1 3'(2'),5'-bisphosphate nucleotidase [Marinomonas sp. UCMA 3892]